MNVTVLGGTENRTNSSDHQLLTARLLGIPSRCLYSGGLSQLSLAVSYMTVRLTAQ